MERLFGSVCPAGSLVGLDVHASKIVAAVLDAETGELRYLEISGMSVRRPGDRVRCAAYEAAPTGYGLARPLQRRGCSASSLRRANTRRKYASAMVVLGVLATTKGGVWTHTRSVAVGLRERGHRVAVGLTEKAGELAEDAAELGLQVRAVERAVLDRRSLLHLHLHDTYDLKALGLLAARRRCGPTVLTEHLPRTDAADERLLPDDRRTPGGRVARSVFKRAQFSLVHQVIAVSTSSGRFLQERYGLLAQKVNVVHNGVVIPPAVGDARTRGEGPMRVVLLGSVIPQKGHDVLIDAARCATRGWRAEVYGVGPCRERLMVAASAVPGRVEFMGWSDGATSALRDADLLCVPSRWEASSFGALEAMAASLPVVASRVDGLDEIVEHDVTGLLVPAEDSKALAAALDDLAVGPVRRVAMGVAGRARAARLWSLERMLDGTEQVYAQARRAALRDR